MSLYTASVPQFSKMLTNLDAWLAKAIDSAKERSFDAEIFVTARLAPDQYPLARQVQSACDSAKLTAARLAGKEAPKHADTETTLGELRQRIQAVLAWLGTLDRADIEGHEKRPIHLPFLEGKVIDADDYLIEFAFPNFYFHVVHAYAILRHNGVKLGKFDYVGSLSALRDV